MNVGQLSLTLLLFLRPYQIVLCIVLPPIAAAAAPVLPVSCMDLGTRHFSAKTRNPYSTQDLRHPPSPPK